ncbi:MAG TPA: hypothetical protein VFK03_02915 [Candidatus Saccharimonadales bacterium]|nr:hypothetical protein [Candidatus Saccharimonadales bacterium]
MAGLYPDIPGTRFALDQDGTVMKWRDYTTSSSWTDVSGSLSEVQKVNTAAYADISVVGWELAQVSIAFPESRSISGLYIHFGYTDTRDSAASFVWESSTDTIDGTDGTWVAFTPTFTNMGQHNNLNNSSKPYYRSDIATLSLNNVKGLRVRWKGNSGYNGTARICVLHLYGTRSGTNRVAFWDPSADQALAPAYLDFGDITQGSSITRQFRIKNQSTQTANGVVVSVSDLLNEFGGNVQVSTDNSSYSSSINIGNLATGAISSLLYIKRTVPAGETTTQHSARLLVNATSWT